MITTYPNGHTDRPEDLLRRFEGRLAAFYHLAYVTVDCFELEQAADVVATPPIPLDIALGILELHADFEQMRDSINAQVAELVATAHSKQGGAR